MSAPSEIVDDRRPESPHEFTGEAAVTDAGVTQAGGKDVGAPIQLRIRPGRLASRRFGNHQRDGCWRALYLRLECAVQRSFSLVFDDVLRNCRRCRKQR